MNVFPDDKTEAQTEPQQPPFTDSLKDKSCISIKY